MDVVIIDTSCANLSSLKFGVERLGYKVAVTDNAEQIKNADKVFLPGVGAAGAAMRIIKEKGIPEIVQGLQQPVLGICLGMQLMTEHSAEGNVDCLGLIPGTVKPIKAEGLRLPHMGWNTLTEIKDSPLFEGINQQDYFYFVHSLCVAPSEYTLATCDYGQTFSASIHHKNFYGVQFHPERSGKSGARVIQNFLEMKQ
ncbi:imidazole glycerol phosphate synthase, glutamine amidotransferase subunit [Catenovulum agarivorans DS-2]|uniref:Imidazole glycerol phosphate synthase subunit HisH n=1 Tax=Catenovulum agarivorans DS-2 TaxID=1328313 RepID=W7QWI0_9ALTE|nr:imidazole glycerol phosphate synthase subunit HisH [Catenovulum agarivorans]EWH09620.1 imidazole glycerol phosphate synthase, glutamine amidotransferase subunit [Catenovulum agarivorans DS-2]